jgi:serine/threonine protein phosphatase PrpC
VQMRSLYGDQVTSLGDVAVGAVGGDAALALSPGRFPKRATTVDRNEDAVLVAVQGRNALLAVADGHRGFTVAEAIVAYCELYGGSLLAADGPVEAEAALRELVTGMLAEVTEVAERARPPRTGAGAAFSVAVVSDGQLLTAAMGDTGVFRLDARGRASRIGRPSATFLRSAQERLAFHRARLRRGDRVICATDGLLDYLGGEPRTALSSAGGSAPTPVEAVEALVSTAFTVGAADHIAVAVWGP